MSTSLPCRPSYYYRRARQMQTDHSPLYERPPRVLL